MTDVSNIPEEAKNHIKLKDYPTPPIRNIYETDFTDADFAAGYTHGPWIVLAPIRRQDLEPAGSLSLHQEDGPLAVMLYRVVSVGEPWKANLGIGDLVLCLPALNSISPQNRYKVIHYEEIIHHWPMGSFPGVA